MPVLLPLPTVKPLEVPDVQDPALKDWLKDFIKQYEDMRNILAQDVNRLSSTAARADVTPDHPESGMGIGVNYLTKRILNQTGSRFKQGLGLADGADRGKVNITYQYLGVGPNIIGSGANVTWTADLAVAGAGGLDTGAEANDTWYYVYMIVGDDTGEMLDQTANTSQPPLWRRGAKINTLLSVSATAPTLPPGFNRFRRVGAVRNNGAGNLYRFLNYTDSPWFWWNEDISAGDFKVLNVTTSAVTFTDVSLAKVVPSTSREAAIDSQVNDDPGTNIGMYIKNKDCSNEVYSLANSWVQMNTGTSFALRGRTGCDASQTIQYRTSATSIDVTLYVRGYTDYV